MRTLITSTLLVLAAGCAGPSAQPTSDEWATHSGYGGHIDNGGSGRFKTGGIMGGSLSDDGRRSGGGGGGTSTSTQVEVLDLRNPTGQR